MTARTLRAEAQRRAALRDRAQRRRELDTLTGAASAADDALLLGQLGTAGLDTSTADTSFTSSDFSGGGGDFSGGGASGSW